MKKGINKYLSAFVMGTALMAVPSCTDSWNEHYQTEDQYTVTETLWELLENNEDLSNFRDIVEKARLYRDENHPAFTINGGEKEYYTFKDVLSANTPVTVWAPTNDALTPEEWQKYRDMIETDGYTLQQQLIGNHMALYRKTMSKTGTQNNSERFRLINSKLATVDFANKMFQESKVIESDIPARNGLLHILEDENRFVYNLYEYIKFSGDFTTFRNYLVERDTTYFMEGSSIEGLPDENGNPTYVDSAYLQSNLMFSYARYNPTGADANDAWMNPQKMFNSQINTEDSSYVVIIPTNDAWDEATKKLKQYYNYGEGVYPRMSKVKTEKNNTRSIKGARRAFNNGKGYETVDSLQTTNIEMDIIWPLSFNINLQPQKGGKRWTKETFIDEEGYKQCEYLLTTTGDTIRDVYEVVNGVKTLVWEKDSLFADCERKAMSNGYALVSNKWNYHRSFWMRDIDVDVSHNYIYDKSNASMLYIYEMNKSATAGWIDQYGRCSEQRYMNVAGKTASSRLDVGFRLQGCKQGDADVMSAKYDVQIVLVPMWYNTSGNKKEPDLPEEGEVYTKAKLTCTLYGWDVDCIKKTDMSYKKQKVLGTYSVDYNGEKVDTFTIMTDVEFPLSYKNLDDAYPTLHIATPRLSLSEQKAGYTNSFNIDRIILKCKEVEKPNDVPNK